ncbi:MAG TPA: hypothetical protein DCX54_00115 [Flavobacteriales bacterium]|nr:hypothetical protein [Flavobacteriales bacterium]
MSEKGNDNQARLLLGLILLIIGFLSPLLSFYIKDMDLPQGLKALVIGGLVFGIPEVFMVIGIAIMGRDAWEFLMSKLHDVLSFISPQRVSRTRYYIGVTLFSLCLVEGVIEIHSRYILDLLGERLVFFHWVMNLLFLLSFFIAGGDFWDKIRQLFIYGTERNSEE